MPEQEYLSSVTLMLRGLDLEPDEASKLLRMRPNQSWRKGDRGPSGKKHEWSGWKKFMPARFESKELDSQLAYWCRALKGRDSAIRRMSTPRNSCVLRCFVTTDETASIVIGAKLQQSLAKLGLVIELAISVHPHDAER
jgi:hypothetical protein